MDTDNFEPNSYHIAQEMGKAYNSLRLDIYAKVLPDDVLFCSSNPVNSPFTKDEYLSQTRIYFFQYPGDKPKKYSELVTLNTKSETGQTMVGLLEGCDDDISLFSYNFDGDRLISVINDNNSSESSYTRTGIIPLSETPWTKKDLLFEKNPDMLHALEVFGRAYTYLDPMELIDLLHDDVKVSDFYTQEHLVSKEKYAEYLIGRFEYIKSREVKFTPEIVEMYDSSSYPSGMYIPGSDGTASPVNFLSCSRAILYMSNTTGMDILVHLTLKENKIIGVHHTPKVFRFFHTGIIIT